MPLIINSKPSSYYLPYQIIVQLIVVHYLIITVLKTSTSISESVYSHFPTYVTPHLLYCYLQVVSNFISPFIKHLFSISISLYSCYNTVLLFIFFCVMMITSPNIDFHRLFDLKIHIRLNIFLKLQNQGIHFLSLYLLLFQYTFYYYQTSSLNGAI